MVASVHGPINGTATVAGAAPAKTVPLAKSVVETIAALVRSSFILILQSFRIAIIPSFSYGVVVCCLISKKTPDLSPVLARLA